MTTAYADEPRPALIDPIGDDAEERRIPSSEV